MATYAELMRQRDAAVKIVNQIEEKMAEMENELFSAGRDMFGIYQLRDGEDLHYHRFENTEVWVVLTGSEPKSSLDTTNLRASVFS